MMLKSKGFTLIEMLVAMLLMTLITSIGYQGGIFFVNKINKSETKLDKGYNEHQVIEWLRKQISQTENKIDSSKLPYAVKFSGGKSEISFVCKIAARRKTRDDTCVVKYLEDSKKIMVYQVDESGRKVNASLLLRDVENFSIRYFGKLNKEGYMWYDSWTGQSRLPVAVQVSMLMDNRTKHTLHAFVKTRS